MITAEHPSQCNGPTAHPPVSKSAVCGPARVCHGCGGPVSHCISQSDSERPQLAARPCRLGPDPTCSPRTGGGPGPNLTRKPMARLGLGLRLVLSTVAARRDREGRPGALGENVKPSLP